MKIGSAAGAYTPGSLHKRFRMSNAQRLNREAFKARSTQIAAAGTAIFGQKVSESEQLSALAVQQMARNKVAALRNLKA